MRINKCELCGSDIPVAKGEGPGRYKRKRFCTRRCARRGRELVPIDVRFLAKVKKTRSCWLWTASKKKGYGQISGPKRGVQLLAHRVSWILANGPIPAGLFVLHRCDTPLCVRPSHLFLGSAAANQEDCVRKGRHPRGERHGRARLNNSMVREIVELVKTGMGPIAISEHYPVGPDAVRRVMEGRTWGHVTGLGQ